MDQVPDIHRTQTHGRRATSEQLPALSKPLPPPRGGFWQALDGAVRRIGTYGAILGVLYVLGGEVFLPPQWRFSHFAGLRLGHTEGTREEAAAEGKANARLVMAVAESQAQEIEGVGRAEAARLVETEKTRQEAARACITTRERLRQEIEARCLGRVGRYAVCDQRAWEATHNRCSEYADILGDDL